MFTSFSSTFFLEKFNIILEDESGNSAQPLNTYPFFGLALTDKGTVGKYDPLQPSLSIIRELSWIMPLLVGTICNSISSSEGKLNLSRR